MPRRDEKAVVAADFLTKDIFMEMKLGAGPVEAKGYDLVVMGRPEGPAATAPPTRF